MPEPRPLREGALRSLLGISDDWLSSPVETARRRSLEDPRPHLRKTDEERSSGGSPRSRTGVRLVPGMISTSLWSAFQMVVSAGRSSSTERRST